MFALDRPTGIFQDGGINAQPSPGVDQQQTVQQLGVVNGQGQGDAPAQGVAGDNTAVPFQMGGQPGHTIGIIRHPPKTVAR